MDDMDEVFKKAKEKAISRIGKVGNTEKPWEDFSIYHLSDRLQDEFAEWSESYPLTYKFSEELLDIINLAAFLYLANQREDSK